MNKMQRKKCLNFTFFLLQILTAIKLNHIDLIDLIGEAFSNERVYMENRNELVEIIQAPMDVLRTAHLKSMLRRQV